MVLAAIIAIYFALRKAAPVVAQTSGLNIPPIPPLQQTLFTPPGITTNYNYTEAARQNPTSNQPQNEPQTLPPIYLTSNIPVTLDLTKAFLATQRQNAMAPNQAPQTGCQQSGCNSHPVPRQYTDGEGGCMATAPIIDPSQVFNLLGYSIVPSPGPQGTTNPPSPLQSISKLIQ